ncbi:MAG: hypothetical protein JO256_05030 [Alphaproteobacteria bacterium]|nr:hypothetical protein [Alphaproteobacteria bacterium]
MKRLAILATATALFSTAAQADEAFDAFRNFCVATHGAAAPALAAAGTAGWAPVPEQSLTQLSQMGLVGAQGRVRPVAGGTALLLTASGSAPQGGGLVPECVVAAVPAGASDLAGQLAAFAAVPLQGAAGLPQGFYAWRDENGRHVPLDQNAPDFQVQMRSGTGFMAMVQTNAQMSMVLLIGTPQ